jgi:hypothetical protein
MTALKLNVTLAFTIILSYKCQTVYFCSAILSETFAMIPAARLLLKCNCMPRRTHVDCPATEKPHQNFSGRTTRCRGVISFFLTFHTLRARAELTSHRRSSQSPDSAAHAIRRAHWKCRRWTADGYSTVIMR